MKAYTIPAKQLAALVDQVTLAHPTLAIDSDPDNNRMLVVATVAQHAEVAETLQSLGVTQRVERTDSPSVGLVIYPIDTKSVSIATSLLEEILPGATIISDVNRIAVRGNRSRSADSKKHHQPVCQVGGRSTEPELLPTRRSAQ